MMSVWSYLGKGKLQSLIGDSMMERLQILLPGLKRNFNSDRLFQMEGLVEIFDAFYGVDALEKNNFRRDFYNSLPRNIIKELSEAGGISADLEWDETIKKLTKISWKRNQDFASKAIEILNLPNEYIQEEVQKIEPDELILPIIPTYKYLKDYQFPIAYRAYDELKISSNRFIIQMPTGSGKTRTATEVICNYLNDAPVGSVVIWLAHSEELCEQAAKCFYEIWPHVAVRELRLIRYWGEVGELSHSFDESAFIVAGFAKLHSLLQRNENTFRILQDKIELIVIDEAHKVMAPTYKDVTRSLMSSSTKIMGLTATPGRTVGDDHENRGLAEFFFNKKLTIETDGTPVIQFLRNRGVLSHIKYDPLYTHQSYCLAPKHKSYLEKYFDLPQGFLQTLADDNIRNIEIVKKIEIEALDNKKILFFACNVEHSKFICALLKFLGISASHVDGDTPSKQRSSILSNFKDGSINVLCNYGVLSTGFDAPKTDVVFISRPTSSIVLYSQMIGRGLRGPAIGGTETCKIIDVRDNIEGFSDQNSVYTFFDDYFE